MLTHHVVSAMHHRANYLKENEIVIQTHLGYCETPLFSVSHNDWFCNVRNLPYHTCKWLEAFKQDMVENRLILYEKRYFSNFLINIFQWKMLNIQLPFQ